MDNLRYSDYANQNGNQEVYLHADFTAEEAAAFELVSPFIAVTFRDGEIIETTLCDENFPLDCTFTAEELLAIHNIAHAALDIIGQAKTRTMSHQEFYRQMETRLGTDIQHTLARWDLYTREMEEPGGRSLEGLYADLYDGLNAVDRHHGRDIMRMVFQFPDNTDGFCLHQLEMLGAAQLFSEGCDYPDVWKKIREEDFEVLSPYKTDEGEQQPGTEADLTM